MKLIYALMAIALLIPACNRNDQNRVGAASEDKTATADQMKHQRDEYVKAAEAKLAEFDQKLDGLDARAGAIAGSAKNDFKNSVDRLRDQRKTVSRKLDDLKDVSIDSWMSLKAEVDTALGDLEKSYEHVSASYEKVPATAPSSH